MEEQQELRRAVILLFLLIVAVVECTDDPCEGLGTEMCPERGFVDTTFYSQNSDKLSPTAETHTEESIQKLLIRQNEKLDRLEDLVKQLVDLVKVSTQNEVSDNKQEVAARESVEPQETGKQEEEQKDIQDVVKQETSRPRGRVVKRYKPRWLDHFQFLSAVRVDAPLSCLHVLPHEGEDGISKYVAVGDESGHLYIFTSFGDLLVDYPSVCTAPITVMITVIIRRNETLLVTGHSNGAVIAHRLYETAKDDAIHLRIEYGHSFTASAQGTPVVNMEMYRAGRMRYLLVWNSAGQIQVFRDNGTLYGTADSPSAPLVFLRTSNTQRLLFLTSSGASSLDLRTMTIRSSLCQGLHNTTLVAYAFEAPGRSKAYGVTNDGNLVYVTLSGDTLNFDCHVKAKRKLEIDLPVKLHTLRNSGYILVANPYQVMVYNTTKGGPRALFTSTMEEISNAFLAAPVSHTDKPLLVCDKDKLVVIGFGEGYLGIFKSNLPAQRPREIGAKVWGGPVFVSIGVVLLGWYFFGRKKEHIITEMTTSSKVYEEIPRPGFGGISSSTVTGSAVVASGGALRKYEQIRIQEKREGGLAEDSARRFSSPSRVYGAGGGATGGFGVGGVNYRNTAVDHSPY